MAEQQIHTISSISGRNNSLSTIQEVSSARYHADSILHCQTFVEGQSSNPQHYAIQDVFEYEDSGVLKSPVKQHHRQTPSITNIQDINQVEFQPSDSQERGEERSRSSATFDVVTTTSPQHTQEIKETRLRSYIGVDQKQACENRREPEQQKMGFKQDCTECELEEISEKKSNATQQPDSCSNLEFNISQSDQKAEEEIPHHIDSSSPTPSSNFREELTQRLRNHAESQKGQAIQRMFRDGGGHDAFLSPQSISGRTSLVSNPTRAMIQRKLNFMREERSPNNLHSSAELAEPIEFAQASTTPRYMMSKPNSSTESQRNEIATPNSTQWTRGKKYNHKKFIEAIANACQKYAVQVLTLENQERQTQENQKSNYNADVLRESILSDLRERRLRVLQRSRQAELNRSKPPSYPKGLLEYSLNSIEKSSLENTPKRVKRHYSALALSQSNSQQLSLSQCSSKKSIPSIEIDLREEPQSMKTQGWQEPQWKAKQAEELARKILGMSGKSKVTTQKRETRKEFRILSKKRVHSQTELRSQELECVTNYSSVITPKEGRGDSSYFFKQMKAKYLAERKKGDQRESVNYIKRNIESLKKQKGDPGKKKILKCNH